MAAKLTVITTDGVEHSVKAPAADGQAIEEGRKAAALMVARGYEEAVACLDPTDSEELQWYRARLRDARRIARLPSVRSAQRQGGDV